MYIVGMMSGTSLDSVDAVLAKYTSQNSNSPWQIIGFSEEMIPNELKHTLLSLNRPHQVKNELHCAKIAEQQITHCYAQAYHKLLSQTDISPTRIKAIAAHGQTVRHIPYGDYPYTLQLLNGSLLSHLTQKTVVCDFRSRDVAAGGQGAPLAPLFHRQLFRSYKNSAVVNIGGISNVSLLMDGNTIGFDCGPGNCLLDEWVYRHLGKSYDNNGEWASQGTVLPKLLARLLSDEFLSQKPPKSTGRDYFHLDWLEKYLDGNELPEDVMRTLVCLTAHSIADCIPDQIEQLIVVGGGANNQLLVVELDMLLSSQTVVTSDKFGMHPQLIEALGFAMLGRETLLKNPVDNTAITGAIVPIILGAIYYI